MKRLQEGATVVVAALQGIGEVSGFISDVNACLF